MQALESSRGHMPTGGRHTGHMQALNLPRNKPNKGHFEERSGVRRARGAHSEFVVFRVSSSSCASSSTSTHQDSLIAESPILSHWGKFRGEEKWQLPYLDV